MSTNFLKRVKSIENFKTSLSKMQSTKLSWSSWVDISFLNYLNLIDYEGKKDSFRNIPWFHISFNQLDIIQYCLRTIYSIYKPTMLNKIAFCDEKVLPNLIHQLLRVSKLFNVDSDADESCCLYYSIAYALFDKDCEDPSLLLAVWDTLCTPNRSKIAVLSGVIGKHRKRKSAKLLRYIIQIAHTARFDFWGAWSNGHKLDDFNYCPVTAALLSGNLEQLSILLQYGFVPNSQRLSSYDKHFMFCCHCIYDWLRKPLLLNGPCRRKIITEVLLFLVNTASSRSQMKRIAMSDCFRLLWTVLPIPLVTRQELQDEVRQRFLRPPLCCHISYFPNTEQQFLKLCDFYGVGFLGEDEPTQPRSLKHLCKCAIRTQLQKSWNLPMGIEDLPLPRNLKSYLHLRNAH